MAGGERRWTVVVVDDSDDFALVIRLWLAKTRRFDVVGHGSDGDEAVDLVAALQPDFVILDDDMPDKSGLDALASICEASPRSKVILYSAALNADRVDLATILGAHAVVSKLGSLHALVRICEELVDGE